MTVGLTMIVKNEAKTLPRLAASLRDQIDFWTISDTGSTDDTIAVAREVFDGVPGQLVQDEWRGFGPCRTHALLVAQDHTDWVMWADADETMVGTIDFDLYANCIETLEHFDNLRYWMPRMVKGPGWEWKGRAHEYLVHPAPRRVMSHSFHFIHHADGGSRGDKTQRDLALLQEDWEEHHDARTAFYLARTYQDVGAWNDAVGWYRTRLTMPGWQEETFYALYSLGRCLLAVGAADEGCGALWASWGLCDSRGDPLVILAEHYRSTDQWRLAWHTATLARDCHDFSYPGLFMDTNMKWRIPYEISIAAWYTGHQDEGRAAQEALALHSDIPEPYLSSVASNLAFYT
jgi:glycosyl transferase family 2